MIGSMLIGEIEQKPNISLRIFEDFETDLHAIDVDYENEDVFFTGWLYESNTPDFNKVNRSQYGRGTDFKQDFVDIIGNNCYNPTSSNCFIKCIIHLSGQDYTEDFLTFIRTEQR